VKRVLTAYLRACWNMFLFCTGLRQYHWSLSPLQQLVNYSARLASRQQDNPLWQRYAVYAYALLKFRENHYFDGMNFVARLPGPLGQAELRNFVLWQDRMNRNQKLPPGFRFNAVVIIDDPDEVQADRLFSATCLSDTVSGLSLFWDEAEADRAFRVPMGLTVRESQRWQDGEGVFDLSLELAPHLVGRAHGAEASARRVALRYAMRNGVPRAFQPSLDPRRQVTNYIKIAHPRSYRLAVSLPEDEDGFADASLPVWLPRLQALTAAQEKVTVCLLNRFVHGADGTSQWPRGIHAVRQAGLTEQDAVAFALEAEGFFGCLDIFGMAARGAGRPGIYIALDPPGPGSTPEVLDRMDQDAPELFMALGDLWQGAVDSGAAGIMCASRRIPLSEDRPRAANAAGSASWETEPGVAGSVRGVQPDDVGTGGLTLRAVPASADRKGQE